MSDKVWPNTFTDFRLQGGYEEKKYNTNKITIKCSKLTNSGRNKKFTKKTEIIVLALWDNITDRIKTQQVLKEKIKIRKKGKKEKKKSGEMC